MSLGSRLTIITGSQGAGKTGFCLKVVDCVHRQKIDVAGVISPAEFDGDKKVGIGVIDLRSGERHLLAVLRTAGDAGIGTIRWNFDREILKWGNQVLASAVPCDLLIVDELGPLEFERGEGWLAGLSVLDSRDYQAGLVVIRPELLDQALQRWPAAAVLNIHNPQQIGQLAENWLKSSSLAKS